MKSLRATTLAALALSFLALASCGHSSDQPLVTLDTAGVSALRDHAGGGLTAAELPPPGATRDNILKVQATTPGPEGFSFAYLGDSRNSSPFSSNGNETYSKVIKLVNQAGVSFALHGGDFTFDNLGTHWRKVVELNKSYKVPLITVIGNHETLLGRSFYEENFTPPNKRTGLDDYSFDYGGARFIALDDANSTITQGQFAWLKDQLQTNLTKIVITHEPPILGEWKVHAIEDQKASSRLLSILDSNNVSLVLLSHIHYFDDSVRRGNTQYILSGGAGAPMDDEDLAKDGNHIVKITIVPGQAPTWQKLRLK